MNIFESATLVLLMNIWSTAPVIFTLFSIASPSRLLFAHVKVIDADHARPRIVMEARHAAQISVQDHFSLALLDHSRSHVLQYIGAPNKLFHMSLIRNNHLTGYNFNSQIFPLYVAVHPNERVIFASGDDQLRLKNCVKRLKKSLKYNAGSQFDLSLIERHWEECHDFVIAFAWIIDLFPHNHELPIIPVQPKPRKAREGRVAPEQNKSDLKGKKKVIVEEMQMTLVETGEQIIANSDVVERLLSNPADQTQDHQIFHPVSNVTTFTEMSRVSIDSLLNEEPPRSFISVNDLLN